MLHGFNIAMGGLGGVELIPPDDFGADLVLWLDANEGVYTDAGSTLATDGQTVQQWNDQSGTGNHVTQGAPSNRPTYRTSGLNSLPSVEYVGADQEVLEHSSFDFGDIATLSVFIVTQMHTETNNGRVWSFVAQGGSQDYADAGGGTFNRAGTTNFIQIYRGGSERLNAAISVATNYRLGFIFDGTDGAMYMNGAAVDTVLGYSPAYACPGFLRIGRSNSTEGWDGYVCEVVMVKKALDADERAGLDAYFVDKWGL